jgi:tyrosyl-tRNA synthetase
MLNTEEKYTLITRNLQEIIGDEIEIKKILDIRPLKLYWGTACTSRIHIGYFVQMLKIADYLKAGCEVTILIADLHAYLDNMKSSLELINHRAEYYTKVVQTMLTSMGINIDKLKFIKGSTFQLSKEYTMDMYKINSFTTIKSAQHAGAEVVKQSDNPVINGLLYPTLQALDEEYLDVDASTGGLDQRKILIHARNVLPKIGYKKRHEFLTKMVSGLRFVKKEIQVNENTLNKDDLTSIITSSTSDDDCMSKLQSIINAYNEKKESENNIQISKMSASNHDSKIDLLDTKKQLSTKINKCYCLSGDTTDNCLMEILEQIIFPILAYKNSDFVINRKDKFGGPIIYKTIDDVKNDFITKVDDNDFKLHPGDFKLGIIDNLDNIIKPVRDAFGNKELQELLKLAYPV